MNNEQHEIVGRILQTIKDTKLSNAAFAKRIGTGRANFSSYLTEKRTVTDRLLLKISHEFGVDYNWLKMGTIRETSSEFKPAKLISRASRLEAIRKALNLSVRDFALRANMTPENVNNIEDGKVSLTGIQCENIGNTFSVNVDYLLDGNGEMFRQPEIPDERRIGDLTVKEFKNLLRTL
jgi:transcriptional regulator with XRE-family HTH domain